AAACADTEWRHRLVPEASSRCTRSVCGSSAHRNWRGARAGGRPKGKLEIEQGNAQVCEAGSCHSLFLEQLDTSVDLCLDGGWIGRDDLLHQKRVEELAGPLQAPAFQRCEHSCVARDLRMLGV